MSKTKTITIVQVDDSLRSVVIDSGCSSRTELHVSPQVDFSVLGGEHDWTTAVQDAVEELEELFAQFSACTVRIELSPRQDDGKI